MTKLYRALPGLREVQWGFVFILAGDVPEGIFRFREKQCKHILRMLIQCEDFFVKKRHFRAWKVS